MQPSAIPIDALAVTAAALRRGEPALVPTATGYALAVNPFDATAVKEIFRLKGRPEGSPLLLLCRDYAQAKDLIEPPDGCRLSSLAHLLWPGSLTIVAPAAEPRLVKGVVGGDGTVAVRVDADPVLRQLLERLDFPLTGTSANRHGEPTPERAAQAARQLPGVALLDGGPRPFKHPSTIIRLTKEGYELIRPGAVAVNEIDRGFSGRCC